VSTRRQWRSPAGTTSIKELRDAVGAYAAGFGAGSALEEAIRVCVSEAVTNVVVHGVGAPDATVVVAAERDGGELVVEIADAGGGFAGQSVGGGLGLRLIGQLTDSFRIVATEDEGTLIRMSFRLGG
jgi:anti-sigma regulatory factor (Ser/Thr protein kinase)